MSMTYRKVIVEGRGEIEVDEEGRERPYSITTLEEKSLREPQVAKALPGCKPGEYPRVVYRMKGGKVEQKDCANPDALALAESQGWVREVHQDEGGVVVGVKAPPKASSEPERVEPVVEEPEPPKRRGRPKKAAEATE